MSWGVRFFIWWLIENLLAFKTLGNGVRFPAEEAEDVTTFCWHAVQLPWFSGSYRSLVFILTIKEIKYVNRWQLGLLRFRLETPWGWRWKSS